MKGKPSRRNLPEVKGNVGETPQSAGVNAVHRPSTLPATPAGTKANPIRLRVVAGRAGRISHGNAVFCQPARGPPRSRSPRAAPPSPDPAASVWGGDGLGQLGIWDAHAHIGTPGATPAKRMEALVKIADLTACEKRLILRDNLCNLLRPALRRKGLELCPGGASRNWRRKSEGGAREGRFASARRWLEAAAP